MAQLSATATEARGCIRGASDVSGFCARTNLIYEILVLRELAQLEVTNHYFTVASFEFVTQLLDGVLGDKSTSCFAFGVNGTSNIAEALAHVIANAIDVAVGCAAAIFNCSLNAIETIFQAAVDSIEAVTNAVCDATELSVYILVVETFEEVRASKCTLNSRVSYAVASEDTAAAQYRKPYKINKPFVAG